MRLFVTFVGSFVILFLVVSATRLFLNLPTYDLGENGVVAIGILVLAALMLTGLILWPARSSQKKQSLLL